MWVAFRKELEDSFREFVVILAATSARIGPAYLWLTAATILKSLITFSLFAIDLCVVCSSPMHHSLPLKAEHLQ